MKTAAGFLTAAMTVGGAFAGTITTNFVMSSGIITEPTTAYWTGTDFNMYLTSSWYDGLLPGRFRDKMEIYDDGVLVETVVFTNGVYGGTMVFDGRVADGGHRTGDYNRLDGSSADWNNQPQFPSVKNAIFTKGCLAHSFHSWRSFIFESGGGIFVDETAPHAPYFAENASLQLTHFTENESAFFLRNDCLDESLRIRSVFLGEKLTPSGEDLHVNLRLQGRGDIEFNTGWSVGQALDKTEFLTIEQTNDARVVMNFAGCPFWIRNIDFAAVPGKRTLEIREGTTVPTYYNDRVINVHSNARILGPGGIRFLTAGNAYNAMWGSPVVTIDSGCTLECGAVLSTTGHELASDAQPMRGIVYTGGGTFEVKEGMATPIEGTTRLMGGVTFKTDRIGSSASEEKDTPFGQNAEIELSGDAKLLYVGTSSEYTDRVLVMKGDGTLENDSPMAGLWFAGARGSGTLTIAGSAFERTMFGGPVSCGIKIADGAKVGFALPDGADEVAVTPASFAVNGNADITVDYGVTLTTTGDIVLKGSTVAIDGAWIQDGGSIGFDLTGSSFEDIKAAAESFTLVNGAIIAYDASEGATVELKAADVSADGYDFVKVGSGDITIVVNETIENPVRIRVVGGKLTLTGTGELKNATCEIADGANGATLDIDGLTVTGLQKMTKNAADNAQNVFALVNGASLTQTEAKDTPSGSSFLFLDGSLSLPNGFSRGSSPSQYIEYQAGGSYSQSGDSYLGSWDTQAVIYQTGGSRSHSGTLYAPFSNSQSNRDGEALTAIITLEGAGTTNFTQNLRLGAWSGSATTGEKQLAALNVNDGATFTCYSACLTYTASQSLATLGRCYVNFDGGTIKSDWTNEGDFLGMGGWTFPHVILYKGGLRVDAQATPPKAYGVNLSSNAPFEAPTGKGVSAVALPDAVAERTFAAPPAVCLIGDGDGATAVALFDRATGKVTGVKITSPGVNYTTCKARWCYQGYDFRAESTCTLADNDQTGGLTKVGSGRFTLSAACTYKGPTCVQAGTLRIGLANAISSESALVLDGGTFDLNNFEQTFADIDCNGGTVANGRPTVTGLAVDFAKAAAGTAKKVDTALCTLVDNAPVTVRGLSPEALAGVRRVELVQFSNGVPTALDLSGVAVPANWSVGFKDGKLVMSKIVPMSLIVR